MSWLQIAKSYNPGVCRSLLHAGTFKTFKLPVFYDFARFGRPFRVANRGHERNGRSAQAAGPAWCKCAALLRHGLRLSQRDFATCAGLERRGAARIVPP